MPDKMTNIKKIKCKNKGIEKICKILENPKTPKIQCNLVKTKDGKIIGSCSLGEICHQLNITDFNIFMVIDELIKLGIPKRLVDDDYDGVLYNSIVNLNDDTNLTKPQIAEKIRAKFGDVK